MKRSTPSFTGVFGKEQFGLLVETGLTASRLSCCGGRMVIGRWWPCNGLLVNSCPIAWRALPHFRIGVCSISWMMKLGFERVPSFFKRFRRPALFSCALPISAGVHSLVGNSSLSRPVAAHKVQRASHERSLSSRNSDDACSVLSCLR